MTGHIGHCDLSVIQPKPNLSSSSKPWQNPFVQQTKYSTHQAMTTLHTSSIPLRGMHQVLCRKDRYQFYSPVITNKSCIPIPTSLFLLFSILLLRHSILNKLAVTLGHQSSDAEPQHAMTMYNPYNNSLVGNNARHNET